MLLVGQELVITCSKLFMADDLQTSRKLLQTHILIEVGHGAPTGPPVMGDFPTIHGTGVGAAACSLDMRQKT